MRILGLFGILAGLTAASAQSLSDANKVDLELVLAVDISYSMDADELRLQRDGYMAAITSSEVVSAITQGTYGRIALTYVEWAGARYQNQLIDWQIVDGPETARQFADKLAEQATNRSYRTSISGALEFSANLFETNGVESLRRVIDISGDGANNQGHAVSWARDQVIAQGITINGLPLTLKGPSGWTLDIANLEHYYTECVIGGPGAFVIGVRDKGRFAEAIRTKLILEIAGLDLPPRIIRAQHSQIDCMMGEKIWRDRYGDQEPDWQ